MSIRFKRAISACILTSVFVPTFVAYAATYYVATTGSDGNPGTEKQPWRTIAYSVNSIVAGDTVYVKGGVYNEGTIRFRRSGTKSAPIKLLNAPGESPVIHCIDPKQIHRIILQHESGDRFPIGWITIEGFEIRNCWEGIKGYNIHDSTFRGNWIHNNLNQGFLGSGTRVVFDRNRVNHNGPFSKNPASTKVHGLYANGTAWTITNNLFYDNLGYGIQLNGASGSIYDSSKHAGPEFAVSHNWVIANNTIAYNVYRAGMVIWGSTCNNARIENNIFYKNSVKLGSSAVQGIDFASTGCTGLEIRNNLFYASGAGGTRAISSTPTEGVHYTQSDNLINVSAPAFVNAGAALPPSPNFALTAQSPAIDAGRSLDITKIAIDGTARPQGRAYDIGAYEYTADGNNQSPDAPTALRVR